MVYVTSDLHGYPLQKFLALLENAQFGKDDFLFVLGDVIDRGPEGAELLRWLTLQSNVQLILGNHESMLLACSFLFDEVREDTLSSLNARNLSALQNWKRNGAYPTIEGLSKLHHSVREGILDYLYDAPLYEWVEAGGKRFLLVHAGLGGFRPDRPIEDYDEHELVWERPSMNTRYSSDFITVFGHTPTLYLNGDSRGRAIKTDTWINIDVGAAAGLPPMLLRLDDLKEFYE
jgi:serine/threonine protein phosphatase 1